MDTDRQKVKQDLGELRSIDGAAVGWEADFEAKLNAFAGDCAGGALQNLLSTPATAQKTTFSGPLCPKGIGVQFF